MRTLRFIVNDDTIQKDPVCSFSGLFPGANKQIEAVFSFSPEWGSGIKVAAFWSIMDKEYPPQVINDNGSCQIPEEALKRPAFRVQIIGNIGGRRMRTNKLTVYQGGDAL